MCFFGKVDMDSYIVLDLEWNQSPNGREYSNKDLPFEIIEIGAVKLNSKLEKVDEFHRVIRPTVYKKMHFKVHEVVQIGIGELKKKGIPFVDAIKDFFDFCELDDKEKKTILCTWGNLDLVELQRNMKFYEVDNKFEYPLFYYDIQKLFNIRYPNGEQDRIPLERAVNMLGIESKRPFHHALDDAFYTAKVMQNMDLGSVSEYYSLDYYRVPRSSEEEIYLHFSGYSKFVSTLFPTKEDAIADKHNSDLICDRCNRMLKKKIKWFSTNQRNYYCIGTCPEHGFVKGKIRVRKSDDEYYVIKTTKVVDTATYEELKEKYEESKKKRLIKSKRRLLRDTEEA